MRLKHTILTLLRISIYKLVINKYLFIIVCICTINQSTHSQSYFFTQEQSNNILEQLNKPKVQIKKKRIKKKLEYKISGICYFGPNNWIVWINGDAYNKIGQYKNFSIDEVHPDIVTITTADCKTLHLSVTCENNSNTSSPNK